MSNIIILIDKYNYSVTPSPFLICFEKQRDKKFWKKYKLQEITIDGNHFGINQIEIQETLQFLLKRHDSKWLHVKSNYWSHWQDQIIFQFPSQDFKQSFFFQVVGLILKCRFGIGLFFCYQNFSKNIVHQLYIKKQEA